MLEQILIGKLIKEASIVQVVWNSEVTKKRRNSKKEKTIELSGSNETNKKIQFNDEDKIIEIPKKDIWFIQNVYLMTSATNVYNFSLNVSPTLGEIYSNSKSGIVLYDGTIGGFRFSKFLEKINPNIKSNESTYDIYCDVRNKWILCIVNPSLFCDSLKSFHLVCNSPNMIRFKSILPPQPNSTHEYEWCSESFEAEIVVFENYILVRLLNYQITRNNKSIEMMQFSPTFHKYLRFLDFREF